MPAVVLRRLGAVVLRRLGAFTATFCSLKKSGAPFEVAAVVLCGSGELKRNLF